MAKTFLKLPAILMLRSAKSSSSYRVIIGLIHSIRAISARLTPIKSSANWFYGSFHWVKPKSSRLDVVYSIGMSATPKRGLGRGFEALISQDFDKSLLLTADDRVEKLPLDQLQANPNQPRRHFDETTLAELAASIKRHGIIQPLVVTPVKNGKYNLIAGERRWRA